MATINGPVVGIVSNTADATRKGRVQVRIPTLPSDQALWARVCGPFGSTATAGQPQVSDEVLVMFEHGDINRPVVLGKLRG